jgi:hypothetical protein
MSERKNIKRNKTRKGVDKRPFSQSMQHNYSKPKPVNKDQLKLI